MTSNAELARRIADLQKEVRYQQAVIDRLRRHLYGNVNVDRHHRGVKGLTVSSLSPKQLRILTEIETIQGTKPADRRLVEYILRDLVEEKVSKPLALAVRESLNRRDWGVRCPCGEAASLIWLKNRRAKLCGVMGFSHTTNGKRCVHAARTIFPKLILIDKVDRRRTAD